MTNRAFLAASTALSFLRIGRGRTTPGVGNPPAPAHGAKKPRRTDDKAKPVRENPEAAEPNPNDDEDEEGNPDSDKDELEGRKGKKKQAARHRERARIAAILSHPSASANFVLASAIAFDSGLDRAAGCKVLGAAPAASATTISLADRMARAAAAQRGPERSRGHAIAASWDKAAMQAETGRNSAGGVPASSWDAAMEGPGNRR
jgi:hypothetical protein